MRRAADPKIISEKTRERQRYLQQTTKPLHFKLNLENIQKVNPNGKAKQKTQKKHKADLESKRNSETDEEVDTFITKSAGFSTYRHHAFQTELKQNLDQCEFKTKTLHDWQRQAKSKQKLQVEFMVKQSRKFMHQINRKN